MINVIYCATLEGLMFLQLINILIHNNSRSVYRFLADLYYGGDTFSVEQPQSFTCPYCGKMGFTETSLQEHVTSEHAETSTEVVSVLHAVKIPTARKCLCLTWID